MERRAFLERSGAAGLALSLPGGLAASRPSAAVAQQSAGYEPLGRVSIDNAAEAVVGDHGEIAYVAATTGFVTVDVSDPTEPTVLAEERDVEIDGSPLTNLLDLAVDGDRLVVAGPAESVSPINSGDQYLGVRCYDVSDPAAPVPTGAYETGYHVHNCYLEDELLFVPANTVDRNSLVILDVGGDEITQLGYWSLLDHEPGWGDIFWLARYLHDISVHDDIAYLPFWNAGTYLVDVSDPTDPSYVSHVRTTSLADQRRIDNPPEAVYGLPGNDHYAMVDDAGDLLAVGREAWATGGADPDRPGGIDLYDVSDPARPTHRGSIDPPRTTDESRRGGMWTTSHNFELRDGHLYSSWYRAGVKIHDVSDPTAPERVAWWRDPNGRGSGPHASSTPGKRSSRAVRRRSRTRRSTGHSTRSRSKPANRPTRLRFRPPRTGGTTTPRRPGTGPMSTPTATPTGPGTPATRSPASPASPASSVAGSPSSGCAAAKTFRINSTVFGRVTQLIPRSSV